MYARDDIKLLNYNNRDRIKWTKIYITWMIYYGRILDKQKEFKCEKYNRKESIISTKYIDEKWFV